MPKASQGDIFQAAHRVDFAVVFGHVGFNEMRQRWVAFAQTNHELHRVNDPFKKWPDQALQWSPGRWLWFVPEQDNHGMTDEQLRRALDDAFGWASRAQMKSAATNGIADTDHGRDAAANRRSDETRAKWLKNYAEEAERKYGFCVELVSLNDVFLRE